MLRLHPLGVEIHHHLAAHHIEVEIVDALRAAELLADDEDLLGAIQAMNAELGGGADGGTSRRANH